MASLSPAREDVPHVWIPAAGVCRALYLGMPCRWPLGKARYLCSLSTLAWHGVFSPTSLEHHGEHKSSHLCQPFPSLCTSLMRPNRPKQFCLQFSVLRSCSSGQVRYQCFHGSAIGRCNGFTVTCAGRCIPRLDPCSRSLLSTLLGDALSLAIGQSSLLR